MYTGMHLKVITINPLNLRGTTAGKWWLFWLIYRGLFRNRLFDTEYIKPYNIVNKYPKTVGGRKAVIELPKGTLPTEEND